MFITSLIDFPSGESEWPLALQLSTGKVLTCDLVVVATGVVPNCEVFQGVVDIAPVTESGGGIRVDNAMHTSATGKFLSYTFYS
jgi:NADPH-dependent 2,4-dienoyl-CoA reductase/sulfur reductase-like enzyme